MYSTLITHKNVTEGKAVDINVVWNHEENFGTSPTTFAFPSMALLLCGSNPF